MLRGTATYPDAILAALHGGAVAQPCRPLVLVGGVGRGSAVLQQWGVELRRPFVCLHVHRRGGLGGGWVGRAV